MKQSINIYPGYLRPTINSTVKPPLTDLLSLKYVKSIDYGNYIFRQTTSMFITSIVKLVIKYVFLRDNPSKILKEIFLMMLKITLKSFGSMLTTKEKPM